MIANRVEAKPASEDRADAARPRLGAIVLHRHGYRVTASLVALAAMMFAGASAVVARQQGSSSSQPEAEQQADRADVARAVKEDIDVGTFYMHKGDYGAAISRFEGAIRRDPKNSEARLRLAEAYEKQKNWSAALKTYQHYLREFPNARDEKKIRKKIDELSRKSD